ncbi:MAG TPA: dockerin type I domain-containing protein, partial [Saprospiraceae bacterium]|nr:dockerin type I domain-containing protein [Saprospiraceae bacterium]
AIDPRLVVEARQVRLGAQHQQILPALVVLAEQHEVIATFAATGYTITAEAWKNSDPLNGISTLDLALIQKQLLGIEPINSPYQIIAADANQDGQVTSFDLVLLKQLILGDNTQLPNGRSWRIIPLDYAFPDPLYPFAPPFPEKITVSNTVEPAPDHFYFMGIKIGDVNFSADPGQ